MAVTRHVPTTLSPMQRAELSRFFGVEIPPVAVSVGTAADAVCRSRQAAAVTAGRRIFVSRSAGARNSFAASALVAHEVAHVLQQTLAPPLPPSVAPLDGDGDGDPWEAAARRAGLAFALGRTASTPTHAGRRASAPAVQAYDSYEHWLLGDAPYADLVSMVAGQGKPSDRDTALREACAFLEVFYANPEATAAQIQAATTWPVRVLQLQASGLFVTYGELNTLADYFAFYRPNDGESFDQAPARVMLPILQMIRESGWNALNQMLTSPTPGWKEFPQAVFHGDWVPASYQSYVETPLLDLLTTGMGPGGRDHINGLLARNACHFAPFSWHRWKAYYQQAVSLAQQSYANHQDPSIAQQAWLMLGYANHFLQDSFAAGHLVNKTLVMQWFVEWAADQDWLPVYDWDSVKLMTTAAQPALAGMPLYDPGFAGPSNDPQTCEEQPTFGQRIGATGIQAALGNTQAQNYASYLDWLDSPVCQIVTAELHDLLNARGVSAQAAGGGGFQTYGDHAMLQGGTGPGLARHAALMAEASIQDILTTGTTGTTAGQIMATFPTQVQDSTGAWVSLQDWHARGGELYRLATSDNVFNSWKTWGSGAGSYVFDAGVVSVDQPAANRLSPVWSATPAAAGLATELRTTGCVVGGQLWLFYVPTGSTTVMLVRQPFGPGGAQAPLPAWAATSAPPAATVLADTCWVAFTTAEGAVELAASSDGESWAGPTPVPGLGSGVTGGPALCAVGDTLLLVAPTAGGQLVFCTYAGGAWSTPEPVADASTPGSPALAALGDGAVLAYGCSDRTVGTAAWSPAGWTTPARLGSPRTNLDVTLAVLPGGPATVYCMFAGRTPNPYWLTSTDGVHWSGQHELGSYTMSGAPALVATAGGDLQAIFPYQGGLFSLDWSSATREWASNCYGLGGFGFSNNPPVLVEFGEQQWVFLGTLDGVASACWQGLWSPLQYIPGTSAGYAYRVGATIHVGQDDQSSLWVSFTTADGTLYVTTFDGSQWSSPIAVTGAGAATGASAVVDYSGDVMAFYISNAALCWATWDEATGVWTHNGTVPGVSNPLDVSATVWEDQVWLGYIDGAKRVMTTSYDGTWGTPAREGGDSGTSVSVAVFDDALVLWFVGTDGYLRATFNTGLGWQKTVKFEKAYQAPGLTTVGAGDHAGELIAVYPCAQQYHGMFQRSLTSAAP